MVYHKTPEGRAALRERSALSLRERQLMVLFNGSRTMKDLADLFGLGVAADVDRLERRGFVVGRPDGVPFEPRTNSAIPHADLAQDPPPTRFLASTIDTPSPLEGPISLPLMTLEELTTLADVPPPIFADRLAEPASLSGASEDVARTTPEGQLATNVYSICAEQLSVRTPLAAQAYMTQVLMALDTAAATALVESSDDVQHDVDILIYVAQGIGYTYAVAGEDVALRVAMRVSGLLPGKELPMLLDCTMDYVPNGFSVLLYEFVLAGRDTAF
jgi:hypothetical protein